MKTLFLLVFFCCTTVLSFAQCGNITLPDKDRVDNFRANYPGCTNVGILTISGPDITDLDSLSGITQASGIIIQNNPVLSNLE